jgi:hypothetical protein
MNLGSFVIFIAFDEARIPSEATNKANESTSPDTFMAFIMPALYVVPFHDWEHYAICSAA